MTAASPLATPPTLRPHYFGPGEGRMFGVFHPAQGAPRGAVLVCPPLLHEQVRSYRFFVQVAQQLADAGFACLRFDYRGSGDSDGDDAALLPSSASADIVDAAAQLRALAGALPLTVLAIRGAALLLAPVLADLRASALWLWQPVTDGRGYLDALDRQAASEHASRRRYPRGAGTAPRAPTDVVGFRMAPAFREALAGSALSLPDVALPTVVLDADDRLPVASAQRETIALPESVTRWAHEIDLLDLIRLRDAAPALATLQGFGPSLLPLEPRHG